MAEETAKIEKAVDEFAAFMKRRLRAKLKQGYRGWDNRNLVFGKKFHHSLAMDVIQRPRQKAVDIANRAMMLWFCSR